MNLLDKQVTHGSFGKGSVVACDGSYIEVAFPVGTKKFVFPDAFGTHLTLVDRKLAKRVDDLRKTQEAEQRRMQAELEEKRIAEEEERQRLLAREKLVKSYKLNPVSQVAFWCDQEDQDRVFAEWRVFTGLKKSGAHAEKPNRLVRLHQNSCCLITAREEDAPEEERRVVGLFMVGESFVGKLCEDGYIPAHSQYRLRLSPEEAKELPFWKYYVNERYPNSMTWNSGRYRYFDNVWTAQILQDIVALKEGTDQLDQAKGFLEHFCEMNRIEQEELPSPNGALVRASA
jgi:hypothetical protein